MDIIFAILIQIWLYQKKIHSLSQHHGLPHWKCVLRYCDKFPDISITHQEKNKDATNRCSTIHFHVYHNVSRLLNFLYHH